MTEQLIQTALALEDTMWRVLDLPPGQIIDAVDSEHPFATEVEVSEAYADLMSIGISDRYAEQVNTIKEVLTLLSPFARIEIWHAIGRIAGAI